MGIDLDCFKMTDPKKLQNTADYQNTPKLQQVRDAELEILITKNCYPIAEK